MLKELFEALSQQAVRAAGPLLTEVDRTNAYAVRKEDGTVDIVRGEPDPRSHKAQDLKTIVAFAERFAGDDTLVQSAIWYSRERVVCLMDDNERSDGVTLDMIKSKQIIQLMDLEAKKPLLDQRAFIFMLRTVLTPSAFPHNPKLIDVLRVVNFEQGQKSEGNIQRGKTSIGKSATAAATFLDDVPEQVTVSVPLFENSFMVKAYDVLCALEIYEAEMRFQLFPLPGEIEDAFAQAEADISKSIRDLLGDKDAIPLYYGAP